jgi:hypothetical protein
MIGSPSPRRRRQGAGWATIGSDRGDLTTERCRDRLQAYRVGGSGLTDNGATRAGDAATAIGRN